MKTEQSPRLIKISTWLAGGVALLFTLALPLVFLLVSYHQEQAILETESEINARLVGRIVADIPELWRFRTHHLEAFLNRRPKDRVNEIRRIVDLDGTLIAQSADPLAEPVIWRGADLFDAGVVVARLEIGRSLRPMLYQAVGFAGFGLALGLVVFTALRVLPVRALRRALTENDELVESLEKQKTDLLSINTALAESRQQLEQSTVSLRQSEQRFAAFMDRSPAIAFIKDELGRYIYVNKTWEEIYALDWHDKTDAELWPSDNAAMFTASDRRSLDAGKATDAFETVLDKDGRPQNWWVMKFPIVDADGKCLLGGMAMDITEQTRKQEKLEEAHTALSHAMPGIARLDTTGRYIEVNDMFAGMLGSDPAELIDTDWSQTVHCEDRPSALASYERMLEVGQGEFEARGVRKDGSTFFSQVLMVKIVDKDGRHIGQHCFMRDIDERKAAEQALLDSELKLRRITAAMPGAVYQFERRSDGGQRFLSISEGIQDLIGYGAAAVVDDFSLLWDAVIPEDREELTNSILRSAQTLTPWEFEGRVRLSDQSVKWLRGHAVPAPRRADGSIVWNGILTDITDRKRAELEVSRLAAIVENSGDAIISRGLDLRVLSWNAATERMFGYRADEVLGRSVDFLIPDELRDEVAQKRAALATGDRVSTYDTVRVARGGKRIDVSVTQSPITDVQGRLIAVSLTIRDITARKRAEQALRASERSIRRLLEIANQEAISFDTRIRAMLEHACQRLGVANGAVTQLVEDSVELLFVHSPAGELQESARIPLSEAYCTAAFGCEGAIAFEHVGLSEMRDHTGYRMLGFECYLGAKIMVQGELFGALCFVAKQPRGAAFSESDKDFLKLVSAWIGAEMARRQAEDAVRSSRDRIRQIIDTAPNLIFVKDREGRFTLVNQAVAELYGTTVANLVGKTDADFNANRAEVDQFRAVDLEVLDSGREHLVVEEPVTDATGKVRWLQTVKRPIVDGPGHASQVLGVATDITARKLAEYSLRESERHLRTAQSIAHLGSWEWDFQTGRNTWSEENYRIFGCEPGSIAPSYDLWVSRIHPDDRSRVLDHLSSAFKDSRNCDIEYRVVHPNGEVRSVHWRGELFRDASGSEFRLAGTALDITERKRAEDALRHAYDELERRVEERTAELQQAVATLKKTEAMLHQAVDVAEVGIFERDHDSDEVYYSPTLKEILGLSDDQPGRVGDYMSSVYGDDREMVNLARQRARLPSGHGHISLEHRIARRDGSTGWVLFRGQTIFGGAGDGRRPVRTVGAVLDITERKRAEEALLASEERLRYALTVGKMGSWELDLRTNKVSWDERTYDIFGIPKGTEVDSNFFWAYVDPDHVDAVRDAHENSIRTGIDYDYDFRFNRPDGRTIWIHANGGLRRDRNGAATHLAGINLDITERKAAEEALRKLNEQLDQRVTERTQELAESQAGLRGLVAELTKAEERERRRIAVELHDTLAQSLAVANMYLWRIRELLGKQANKVAISEVLANLDRTVDDSIKYTRSLIAQLSPPVLYDLGLPAAFRWLGEQMSRHGLGVEVDGPADGFSLAEGDAVFLFQCVRELLWNVFKHGATDRAKVTYGRDASRLSVAVVDQGKGFDLQTVYANGDGSGHFGLFSIRERVELRGGSLEINSTPGAGTWVTIVIPTDQPTAVPASIAKPLPVPRKNEPAIGDAIKIVIVDDHKMLRQGLRRVLEEQGRFMVVGEASDGAEALLLMRDLEPAVVIMDVNMPSMNGIEATERIIHDRPSTIVIGLSFGTEDYVVRAMQAAGAVTCLAKERAVEDVSAAIMDALAERRVEKIDNGNLTMEN